MPDLSFKTYINERANLPSERTYYSPSNLSCYTMYHEYIKWVQGSLSQSFHARLTATQILTQLKIINAYYFYLIDYYKKTKEIQVPLKLVPVPENLTQPSEQPIEFTLPSSDLIEKEKYKKQWFRNKIFGIFVPIEALIIGIFGPMLISANLIMLPILTPVLVVIYSGLLAWLALAAVFMSGDAQKVKKLWQMTEPYHPDVAKVMNIMYAVCFALSIVMLSAPLFSTFHLGTAIVLGVLVQLPPAFGVIRYFWRECLENRNPDFESVVGPLNNESGPINNARETLCRELATPDGNVTADLKRAVTATTHCILASRFISELEGDTQNPDQISVPLLKVSLQGM